MVSVHVSCTGRIEISVSSQQKKRKQKLRFEVISSKFYNILFLLIFRFYRVGFQQPSEKFSIGFCCFPGKKILVFYNFLCSYNDKSFTSSLLLTNHNVPSV